MNARKPINPDVPNLLKALKIEGRLINGEFWACCPYPGHTEKTASWSIRWDGPMGQENGINSCFGCKCGGGVVSLVKACLGLRTNIVAIEWIRDKGLDLGGRAPMRTRLVINDRITGLKEPPGIKIAPLDQWATPARRYALQRNLTEEQVDWWGLGYGTVGNKLGRLYIPTYNRYGELVNWNMRKFHNGDGPKYLNPTESEGAKMSSVFGEQGWPESRAEMKTSTLVLCEGELNALACERAGVEYVGAIGGSDIDPGQLLRFGRFGRIILALDVDAAGSKATAALKASLVRWRDVGRLALPERKDPCDIEDDYGIDTLSEMLLAA